MQIKKRSKSEDIIRKIHIWKYRSGNINPKINFGKYKSGKHKSEHINRKVQVGNQLGRSKSEIYKSENTNRKI